jgi:hypothetical protein
MKHKKFNRKLNSSNSSGNKSCIINELTTDLSFSDDSDDSGSCLSEVEDNIIIDSRLKTENTFHQQFLQFQKYTNQIKFMKQFCNDAQKFNFACNNKQDDSSEVSSEISV